MEKGYVESGKIILDGQDAAKEIDGDYFLNQQPFKHHTGPSFGYNYSLGSGSCSTNSSSGSGPFCIRARNFNTENKVSTGTGFPHPWVATSSTSTDGSVSDTAGAGPCSTDSGYYCYSFCTNPESIQPTGSCNFSKFLNPQLQLRIKNFSGYGTATATSTKVHVFAHSYNVFRVMDGMGGLVFDYV